ncbi:MAG: hypothetical protein PHD53_00185 [Methylococcales bacterium]|nr:hypothetical protein [Methylococcales bacterium]
MFTTIQEAKAARNQALVDSDRYMIADFAISEADKLAVQIYRRNLRFCLDDLTDESVVTFSLPAAPKISIYKL